MLNISLLTIGDEICIGQVVNTNSSWLASNLSKSGCRVVCHSTIEDNKQAILSEIDRLINISDVLVITGGLGPTHDDITKPVLCEYFDDILELHQESLEQIRTMFEKRGIKFTDRNKDQALLPTKCKALYNHLGTAPGMLFIKKSKYIFALPGVPAEMKYISENHVFPIIKKIITEKKEDVVLYRILHTTGIPESHLADLIGDPYELTGKSGNLAFLPSYQGVRLRIGVQTESFEEGQSELDRIESILKKKAGKYIFGKDTDSLSSQIGSLLKSQGLSVSVAESCTGGMLGASFTDSPGSSAYFTGGAIVYSNDAKIKILGVNPDTILKYGAVSGETAIELAVNVRDKFNTDYGISITGIAGPGGGTDEKPVGTVFFGISGKDRSYSKKYILSKDRSVNRERSVGTALALLLKELKG